MENIQSRAKMAFLPEGNNVIVARGAAEGNNVNYCPRAKMPFLPYSKYFPLLPKATSVKRHFCEVAMTLQPEGKHGFFCPAQNIFYYYLGPW